MTSPETAYFSVEVQPGAQRLRLSMAGSRTLLRSAESFGAEPPLTVAIRAGSIVVGGPLPSDSILLRLSYQGEAPVLGLPEWDAADPGQGVGRPEWRRFQERQRVANSPMTLADGDIYQFFTKLEGLTNESILCGEPAINTDPCAGKCEQHHRIVADLCLARSRWQQRVRRRAIGQVLASLDTYDHRLAASISSLMAPVFAGLFGQGSKPDYDRLWQAMSAFANGALRVDKVKLHLNAEPTSAQFFLFAEFAFIATDPATGLDADQHSLWLTALPAFVGCQRIFMEVYRPNKTSPKFEDYTATNFGQPWAEARLDQLREEFRKYLTPDPADHLAELERIHTENTTAAFPGEGAATQEGAKDRSSATVLMLSATGEVLGRQPLSQFLPRE